MKASAVLLSLATVATTTTAGSFSAEDQAIWIDRHNFFRTTALPWSAGNMRRIGWDAGLATRAASTAAECSTTTEAGVNAFQSTTTNSMTLLDDAVKQWIVDTSLQTFAAMAQPGSSGVEVGVGVYNSYSQVVWASTTSVGCASASCPAGDLVVCEYSPAGNDNSSAWYVHDAQASKCPTGTTASDGLCIVQGDAANNQIAPIPDSKLTHQVYPAYVVEMQTALLQTARGIANGTPVPAAGTSNSTTSSTPAPQATTAVSSVAKPSNSTSASSAEQEDRIAPPGTVKASLASGSKFSNEVTKPPSSPETTIAQDTTAHAESTTTSTADNGLESRGISTPGLVGMFIVGVGAVAGIVVYVHYRVNKRQQDDVLLDGGIRRS